MTSKLTREQLHERARENVKALKMASRQTAFESAREEILADLQLAELALAAMDSEPVAWTWHYREQWHVTRDKGRAAFVATDGDVAVLPLYRHAQPAPVVVPDGLRLALSNAGIAAPESDEMLAATCEKHIQALVTWVKDRKPFQSAPVALEGVLLDAKRWRALLGSARIQILGSAGFDAVVHPGENPDYRHFGMEIWTHYPDWPHEKNEYGINTLTQYADAMLQGGNSPVISDGSADMLRRWLAFGRGMQNAGSQLPHNLIAETESMLAAAPQSPGSEPATVPGKWIPVSEQNPDCWCLTCRPVTLNDMRFVVCPDCGNKRCPRANDHRNSCTGSNEPGQEDSAYPDTPREVKP